MASKKSDTETVKEVDVSTDSTTSLPVLEVKHPGPDASEDFLREQDEALLRYKQTGERGIFIDPTRDQEPDIAPELGLSPHPEHANPRAPELTFGGGVNLDASRNPVIQSVEDKNKAAEAVVQAREEATRAAEEANPTTDEGTGEPATIETPASVNPGRSESPTTAAGDPRATE